MRDKRSVERKTSEKFPSHLISPNQHKFELFDWTGKPTMSRHAVLLLLVLVACASATTLMESSGHGNTIPNPDGGLVRHFVAFRFLDSLTAQQMEEVLFLRVVLMSPR